MKKEVLKKEKNTKVKENNDINKTKPKSTENKTGYRHYLRGRCTVCLILTVEVNIFPSVQTYSTLEATTQVDAKGMKNVISCIMKCDIILTDSMQVSWMIGLQSPRIK